MDKKTLLYLEESRKKMTPIQRLIDDLYWEYDRMSSSGQATLDKLNKIFFKMDTDQYSFVPVQWREHYAKAEQRKKEENQDEN